MASVILQNANFWSWTVLLVLVIDNIDTTIIDNID
jgi:hypothetical protein